jgi:ubiquinone/menaquinone biosynthesis C-methylase UbiE
VAAKPDPDIVAFYSRGLEHTRLDKDRGVLERIRTEELLRRYLPASPAVVVDVGGGSGVYAEWLASIGYTVHLVDPVPLHLEQARQRASAIASISEADARHLPDFADGFADAVLLLGPLYHLTTLGERAEALQEARRILKPGGTLAAAAICRFASALDGLVRGFFSDPRYAPIAWEDLRSGQHRGAGQDFFTTAYLHRPEEFADEVRAAGFQLDALLAIEGPGWLLQDFEMQWSDATLREALLEVIRRTEAEPALLGASSHLMAIGHNAGASLASG